MLLMLIVAISIVSIVMAQQEKENLGLYAAIDI